MTFTACSLVLLRANGQEGLGWTDRKPHHTPVRLGRGVRREAGTGKGGGKEVLF